MTTTSVTDEPSEPSEPSHPPAPGDAQRSGTEGGPRLLAAAATVVAAVLTAWGIGSKSLWFDETVTVGLVDRPYGDFLWRAYHWELNQSPYYVLVSGWSVVGEGEAWLRLLSAGLAVASVPALYLLGRRIYGAWVGAVAALLLAVHPLLVQWGQQLRAYSAVVFAVIAATLLLLRAVERPDSNARAAAYAVVGALAAYTHFYALLVVAAHLAWVLLRRRPGPAWILRVGALMSLLLVPLGWYFLTRNGDPLYWVSGRTRSVVLDTAEGLTGGTTAGLVLYAVAAAVGIALTVLAGRDDAPAAPDALDADPDAPPGWTAPLALLAPLWLVLPVVIAAVSTATVKPLLVPRFLIVVVPALALVAAAGICRLPRPAGAVLLAGLLVTSAVGVADWYDTPSVEDWRGATAAVVAEIPPGGPVLVEPPRATPAYRYYERRLGAEPRAVIQPGLFDPAPWPRLAEIRREGSAFASPRNSYWETWREEHYRQVRTHTFQGVVVRIFERR